MWFIENPWQRTFCVHCNLCHFLAPDWLGNFCTVYPILGNSKFWIKNATNRIEKLMVFSRCARKKNIWRKNYNSSFSQVKWSFHKQKQITSLYAQRYILLFHVYLKKEDENRQIVQIWLRRLNLVNIYCKIEFVCSVVK